MRTLQQGWTMSTAADLTLSDQLALIVIMPNSKPVHPFHPIGIELRILTMPDLVQTLRMCFTPSKLEGKMQCFFPVPIRPDR